MSAGICFLGDQGDRGCEEACRYLGRRSRDCRVGSGLAYVLNFLSCDQACIAQGSAVLLRQDIPRRAGDWGRCERFEVCGTGMGGRVVGEKQWAAVWVLPLMEGSCFGARKWLLPCQGVGCFVLAKSRRRCELCCLLRRHKCGRNCQLPARAKPAMQAVRGNRVQMIILEACLP